MAKKTLLQITQDILSEMESDEVNSINDTVESLQVANIVISTFDNIITGKHYPHQNSLLQLQASGDVTKPTHMKLPENVTHIESVRYNKIALGGTKAMYGIVKYMLPEEFIKQVNGNTSSNTNVLTVTDFSSVPLYVRNDLPPAHYTSFDDEYLVFDSYDSAVDNTLQQSKTEVFGTVLPSMTLSDSTIPDIPVHLFPYLINEAKSTCFLLLKQMANQKAEQHSISQRRRLSQDAWRINKGITRPNYGRASKKG